MKAGVVFLLGVLSVPAGAAALVVTWWIVGKAIGLLRFPVMGLVRMNRPEVIIQLLEDTRRSRAFRITVPGFAVLVIADRSDREAP